ncbi:ABC transporter substrate-binding protein [Paenibacillus sinopodophylli]|uniref:ABC transporter substrate-binding protein n=1 Tax=Paenibacillus sinopodophylli TaxID=1837342 RepID=UPI00110CD899|nr:extracellular solute-binding protein [Paenibacillus sinopodophylli]
MMKKTRTKKTAGVMLSVMISLVLVLSACSSGNNKPAEPGAGNNGESSNAAENGNLVIWGWDKSNHDTLMVEFNKNHPNVKVEYVEVSAKDYLKKIQTSLASGSDLPDIIFAEAAQRGAIYALNVMEDIGAAPYSFDSSLLLDFEIPLLSNSKGQLVALDTQVSPGALAYKRDLAKQYLGTDDSDTISAMFTDWDAFLAKGKEVYDKSGGKVTMFASLMDAYTIFINQQTTPLVEGTTINKEVVTNLFTQLQKVRDLNNEGKLSMWSPSWSASYSQSNVIFYPAANWSPQFVIKPNDKSSDGNWGLAVPPLGGFSYGGTSMGIWKDSKQKEAAWTYLKGTYGSEEGAEISFASSKAILPLKASFEDTSKLLSGADSFFGGMDVNQFWIEKVFPSIKAVPVTKYDQDIYTASEIALQTMAQDSKFDAVTAVQKWTEELQKNHSELELK